MHEFDSDAAERITAALVGVIAEAKALVEIEADCPATVRFAGGDN